MMMMLLLLFIVWASKLIFPFNPQELAKEFKAKAPNVADAG